MAVIVLLVSCSGDGDGPATQPSSSAPATTTSHVFDPAAMEAGLLAAGDLGPTWDQHADAGLGIVTSFRFCGDSWAGLSGAKGPRERQLTGPAGELFLQDVRAYEPGTALPALTELERMTGSCRETTRVDAPELADGSHVFTMDFRGSPVTAAFVLAGRYGSVVVTDADPPLPLVRRVADKLRVYAAANPWRPDLQTRAGSRSCPVPGSSSAGRNSRCSAASTASATVSRKAGSASRAASEPFVR